MARMDKRGSSQRRARGRLAKITAGAGAVAGCTVLLATTASASLPILTRGHPYCFYFYGKPTGGMHLVAAGPRVLAAGPSNYISGTYGKPQDTVVYVDCVDAAGNADGSAYVGLPRVVLKVVHGHYSFAERVVAHVHRLASADKRPLTVTVNLSGAVTATSSPVGSIVGALRVSAPSCLAHPFFSHFTGT